MRTPLDRAGVVEDRFGGGEARKHVDAERFGLRREPRAQRAERDDEVAVVVHLRRRDRQFRRALVIAQPPEFVLRRRHADRRRIGAPFGQQLVERLGLDDRAGQDLRADRRGLLDHADVQIGLELLEADREGEPGRARADRDDVVLHRFAFAHGGVLSASGPAVIVRVRDAGSNSKLRHNRGNEQDSRMTDSQRSGTLQPAPARRQRLPTPALDGRRTRRCAAPGDDLRGRHRRRECATARVRLRSMTVSPTWPPPATRGARRKT